VQHEHLNYACGTQIMPYQRTAPPVPVSGMCAASDFSYTTDAQIKNAPNQDWLGAFV